MSTRPEDIPQDVWRIAGGHALSGLATVAFDTIEQNDAALYALTNVVARAILAEREACALIAADMPSVKKLLPFGDHQENEAAQVGQEFASDEIAATIRKRGDDVNTAHKLKTEA